MKKLILAIIFLLLPQTSFAQVWQGNGFQYIPYLFSALPTEQDGRIVFCSNCQAITPCAGNGTGSFAVGVNSQWSCQFGNTNIITGTTIPVISGLTNTQYANQFAGASWDIQVNACLAAIPAGGGTCDARSLTGTQSCAANVAIPTKKVLLVGVGTFTCGSGVQITLAANSALIGQNGQNSTTLITGNVSGDAVVKSSANNPYVWDLAITNSNNATSSSALALTGTNNDVRRVSLSGQFYGLNAGGFYSTYDHISINSGAGTGVFLNGSNSTAFYNLTINGALTTGVDIEGSTTDVEFHHLDLENITGNGLVVGTNAGGAFVVSIFGLYCQNAGSAYCLRAGAHAGDTYAFLYAAGVQGLTDLGCIGSSNSAWLLDESHLQGGGCLQRFQASGGSTDYQEELVGTGIGLEFQNPTVESSFSSIRPLYVLDSSGNFKLRVLGPGLIDLIDPSFIMSTGQVGFGVTGNVTPIAGLDLSGGTLVHGSLKTTQLATPTVPNVTAVGVTGGASYTYFLVGNDGNGGQSVPSGGTTIVNGNTTLTASNFNRVCVNQDANRQGYISWDVLKTNTSTKLGSIVYGTNLGAANAQYLCINDIGQGTGGYTPPTRNSTADFTLPAGSAINGVASTPGRIIATGTSALGTGAITNATCATTVTTSATGVLSTDSIIWSHNGAVTGGTNGSLIIHSFPTTNNVNFQECNPTAAGITPPADTLNWTVVR